MKKLITAYVNPDIDGVAGAMAYGELLRQQGELVDVAFIGEIHREAQYVINRFHFAQPIKIENADAYDEVVLVDASDLNGLEGKVDPVKVVEIIDHRKIHEAEKFPNAKAQIELVGAVVTLITEKFMRTGVNISEQSAMLLYSAIESNTLHFQSSNTTDRDRAAASWLQQRITIPGGYIRDLFMSKSDMEGDKLGECMYGDAAHFAFEKEHIVISQLEFIGVEECVAMREQDILAELRKLKETYQATWAFLTAIDLEQATNTFITNDPDAQSTLSHVLGIRFQKNVAKREGVIMRKQIVPLLKEYFENRN